MEENISVCTRGYLPHWERTDSIYFVTFCLADAIPREVLARLKSERESVLLTAAQAGRGLTLPEKRHISRFASINRYLDTGAGECLLRNREAESIVAQAMKFFDGERYDLFAWCVMPNHVHVVLGVFPGIGLASILHSWKSFTAKKVNILLGRHGEFWQREYYDHLVRNEGDLARVVRYVGENPLKAGLRDWDWVWVRKSLE